MLDLNKNQLHEVKRILGCHLQPAAEVFAYGSRTKQKARKFSDLDLIIRMKEIVITSQVIL